MLVLSHWDSFTLSSSEFKLAKGAQPSLSEVFPESLLPPGTSDLNTLEKVQSWNGLRTWLNQDKGRMHPGLGTQLD